MVAKKKASRKPATRIRNWDALSANYRRRLGRAGISQRDYEAGVNLSAARGHARTPERPQVAVRNPARYPEYVRKRGGFGLGSPSRSLAGLMRRIRNCTSHEAATSVRAEIIALNDNDMISVATMLGIVEAFPRYEDFTYNNKARMAYGWLLAFMTHAGVNVTQEPWLKYVRQTPNRTRDWVSDYWKGPGVINIADMEYRRLGRQGQLDDRDVYRSFKSIYAEFFGEKAIRPRRVHA